MSDHTPNPEHQFVSGPWTVRDRDRATSAESTRAPTTASEIVRRPAELGAA